MYKLIRMLTIDGKCYEAIVYNDASIPVNAKTFTTSREAYKYGIDNFGVNNFQVCKIIESGSLDYDLKE